MKYILKKDLPFAKAGEMVYIKPEDRLYQRIALFDRNTNPYCLIISDRFNDWIEEVKPDVPLMGVARCENCKYFKKQSMHTQMDGEMAQLFCTEMWTLVPDDFGCTKHSKKIVTLKS